VRKGGSRLRAKLQAGEFIAAPGVHDMVTALIANKLGLEFVYGSGYWLVASAYGLPDAGLASFTEMLDCVTRLARVCNGEVIADADTGFGGLLNVERTVQSYQAAGVAAIQIEDQVFPKHCSHTMRVRCVPRAEMVARIRVACEARGDGDMLIIARTDARQTESFSETLARAEAYARAGADILFVESLQSEQEMRTACETFGLPMMVNMNDGGVSPIFTAEELRQMGYRIGIWPSLLPLASIHAVENVLRRFMRNGSSRDLSGELADFKAFSSLIGFDRIRELERKWREYFSDAPDD